MSKEAALFVVVEGRTFDTPFYERIVRSSDILCSSGYQFWLVEQITRSTPAGGNRVAGGKEAMLALYDLYRKSKQLQITNSAGKRSIVFCVDRDVDDISGSLRRSPHIIYTPLADAEACAYIYGDMTKAVSLAVSVDEKTAEQFVNAHRDWANRLANAWRDWIELCCLAAAHCAYCHVGTTKQSTVNKDVYGETLRREVVKAKRVILAKSQLAETRRAQVEEKIRTRLRRVYSAGKQHRLVGKHWIADYLQHLLTEYFGGSPVALKRFKANAPIAFLTFLDLNGRWAAAYRRKLEALV